MTIKDDNEQINDKVDGEPSTGGGGEDESSAEVEGDDSHLHEDQKALPLKP